MILKFSKAARLSASIVALALASPVLAQDAPDNTVPGPPAAATEIVHVDGEHDMSAMAEREATRLLAGYGNGGFVITTSVPEAQAFFSNGMELGAAFAHQPAIDAMKEAVRLDPTCAMCLWGEAFMSGPTLNYGKDAAERKPLLPLARKAHALARAGGTTQERDLTKALIERYRSGNTAKRDKAFFKAMNILAGRYPENDAIQVLAADASLISASKDNEWKPGAERAMALLEPVLARAPENTPAIHFYIHASEIAGQSAKAEPYADTLADLAPQASHLVHMPSHTWYWL
ncbi:MAG: hypothetical protein WAT93_06650, partial [Pontixanthobacter sp.]